MQEIKITIKIRPQTFPTGIKTRNVKDSFNGPMCVTCTCGKHYASFKMDPDKDFNAFRNSLQIAARTFMMQNGIIRPLAGAIALDVQTGVQRPLSHFDTATGVILEDYKYRLPMKLPAFYRIMESAAKCLYGVAFTDMKQVVSSTFSRVYRDCHCIEVTIREVNPSEIDGTIKQLELF